MASVEFISAAIFTPPFDAIDKVARAFVRPSLNKHWRNGLPLPPSGNIHAHTTADMCLDPRYPNAVLYQVGPQNIMTLSRCSSRLDLFEPLSLSYPRKEVQMCPFQIAELIVFECPTNSSAISATESIFGRLPVRFGKLLIRA